jgi:hypothetical protein
MRKVFPQKAPRNKVSSPPGPDVLTLDLGKAQLSLPVRASLHLDLLKLLNVDGSVESETCLLGTLPLYQLHLANALDTIIIPCQHRNTLHLPIAPQECLKLIGTVLKPNNALPNLVFERDMLRSYPLEDVEMLRQGWLTTDELSAEEAEDVDFGIDKEGSETSNAVYVELGEDFEAERSRLAVGVEDCWRSK